MTNVPRLLSALRPWLSDAFRLLLPERCVVCGRRLQPSEECVCAGCTSDLPYTRFHGVRGNAVERIFWARIPIRRANAFLHYFPGSDSSRIFLEMKYADRPRIGTVMGRWMAADLLDTDFFQDVEIILPVPLARSRQRQRGYNQSEKIAEGVGLVTGLPVETGTVERIVANPTQTSMKHHERQKNVENIFRLCQPEKLKGRHLLHIDDILTTGSTLLSCTGEIAKAEPASISILTLGIAGQHGNGPYRKPAPDGPQDFFSGQAAV